MTLKYLIDELLILKEQPIELIDASHKCETLFKGSLQEIPKIFKDLEIELISTSMVIAKEPVKPAIDIFVRFEEDLEG